MPRKPKHHCKYHQTKSPLQTRESRLQPMLASQQQHPKLHRVWACLSLRHLLRSLLCQLVLQNLYLRHSSLVLHQPLQRQHQHHHNLPLHLITKAYWQSFIQIIALAKSARLMQRYANTRWTRSRTFSFLLILPFADIIFICLLSNSTGKRIWDVRLVSMLLDNDSVALS